MTTKLDPSADGHVNTAITEWLTDLGGEILADANALVPVKTGRLRNSLIAEVDGLTLQVGSTDCTYSVDVELGTAPHVIRPNGKKALFWPGAAHPVAQVNHPGTAPHPYLRPALLQPRER